jgi:hypothetical protein
VHLSHKQHGTHAHSCNSRSRNTISFDTTPEELDDFRDKAHALFETVQELIKQGVSVEITDEDKAASHKIVATGKIPSVKNLTPGTIINLEAILTEWDQEVLDVSRRLRNYVTNKLNYGVCGPRSSTTHEGA